MFAARDSVVFIYFVSWLSLFDYPFSPNTLSSFFPLSASSFSLLFLFFANSFWLRFFIVSFLSSHEFLQCAMYDCGCKAAVKFCCFCCFTSLNMVGWRPTRIGMEKVSFFKQEREKWNEILSQMFSMLLLCVLGKLKLLIDFHGFPSFLSLFDRYFLFFSDRRTKNYQT